MSFSKNQVWQMLGEYPKTFIVVGAHSLADVYTFDDSTQPSFFLFEADRRLVEEMQANLNDMERVKIIHACLSDKENEEIEFHNLPLGSSSILAPIHENLTHFSDKFVEASKIIKMQTTTLDAWMLELQIVRPVCLIVDVQGAEAKVLRGSVKILKFVDLLLIEASTREYYKEQVLLPELKRLLKQMNFSVLRKRVDPWNYQGDLLAMNKEIISFKKLIQVIFRFKISDLVWIINQTSISKIVKRLSIPIKNYFNYYE